MSEGMDFNGPNQECKFSCGLSFLFPAPSLSLLPKAHLMYTESKKVKLASGKEFTQNYKNK